MRPTWCEISLDAVARNVETLRALVEPTPLCAVVKADGYGHGAIEVAKTALAAGASWLVVAIVEEGVELRSAGIDAPILVLTEQDASSLVALVEHQLTATVYTEAGVAALDAVANGPLKVHVGLDTGMRRVGVAPEGLAEFLEIVEASVNLEVEALWTHCPVADEPDNDFTDRQLARFDTATTPSGLPTHTANSAGTFMRPERDAFMVRCGISLYGIDPDPALSGMVELHPALTLRSQVTFVKRIAAGEAVGYGHRWTATHETGLVTVPIGYADGVRRDLGLRGGHVLIRGIRHPIRGVVSMDQLVVDVGDHKIAVGDEVIFIGSQGEEQITAGEMAATLDTIPYELVCAISKRVPRRYI